MNEHTLESFMNFCDDFQINDSFIATEGIKEMGKSVWEGIKRVFRKIVTWFGNIIRSVNYFKNATLDSQMNKDLIEVLKIAQPKTELNFQWINYYYKIAMTIPKNSEGNHQIHGDVMGESKTFFGVSHITTVEDQIKRSVYDIDSCLKAAENCDAKARLDKGEYSNKDMVTVPLGQITSDLKKCHTQATKAENELSRIDNASTKLLEHTKGKDLVQKAHVFYSKLSQFYRFRIDILSKFLNYAKASLKGLKNNVKDKFDKDNKLRTNFKPSLKAKFSFNSAEEVNDILETYKKAKEAKTYEEYLPYYKKLADKFKCKGAISAIQKLSDKMLLVAMNTEGEKYPLGGQALYHHSSNPNLKELKPRWSTPAGVLFPTPRVYFHIGVPLNRYSHSLSKDDDNTLYIPTVNITSVYVDKELSRTACYVETTKPIPVKHVEYSKWQKDKDVELGFDKQDKK